MAAVVGAYAGLLQMNALAVLGQVRRIVGERSNPIGNQGFFFEPTVMSEVNDDAKIMNDEPFRPLAPLPG